MLVKNVSCFFINGPLLIHAEGPEEGLNRFIDWCNMGPRLAEVTEVQAEEMKPEGFKTFEVRK